MLKKSRSRNYDNPLAVRNWAIYELLSCTDLDYGELRNIRNNDPDWGNKNLYIRTRKKNLHLSTVCVKAMFDYKMYARWVLAKNVVINIFLLEKMARLLD